MHVTIVFCMLQVSDMDYNILDIRICNGSTNDQFVWQHSDVRNHMYELKNNRDIVRDEGRYYLLGIK